MLLGFRIGSDFSNHADDVYSKVLLSLAVIEPYIDSKDEQIDFQKVDQDGATTDTKSEQFALAEFNRRQKKDGKQPRLPLIESTALDLLELTYFEHDLLCGAESSSHLAIAIVLAALFLLAQD